MSHRNILGFVIASLTAVIFTVEPVLADPPDLAGAWRGGGSVSFTSGAKEKASCRAQFNRTGSSSYAMNATCATASAKVAQSASLRKTGSNTYSGRFTNPDYNVTGSIHITIDGNSQSVSLTSDAGTASFRLTRL